MMMLQKVVALAVALVCLPVTALAQDSHWGVAVSVTPKWTVPSSFKMIFDAEAVDLESTDFSIGIARGQDQRGDWSVSYLRKSFKEGTSTSSISTECDVFSNGCFMFGDSRIVRSVKLTGLEALKFIPFATIKRRVQIGLTVGGGFGKLDGIIEHHEFSAEPVPPFLPGRFNGRQTETVTTEDAKELFPLEWVPLAKVEIAVGVIVAPGLKIRAAAGLDFPGQNMFSLTAVYLIGSN
jgi:hypothetical protein